MNLLNFCILVVSIAILIVAYPIQASPRRRYDSKGYSETVDLSQKGDINAQVSLKNIQIIALFGDDAFGFGDYDYHYDDSDMTVKPALVNTTTLTSDNASVPVITSTTVPNDQLNKQNSSDHPYPFVSPSGDHISSNKTPELYNKTELISEDSLVIKEEANKNSSNSPPSNLPKKENVENLLAKNQNSPTRISIIPNSDGLNSVLSKSHLATGEILPRKCLDGYVRDRSGGCRKILRRASQLPFGLSRFASSLVSRLHSPNYKKDSTADIHTAA